MKIVELTTIAPALAELLDLAGEDTLILKTSEGRAFVLAEVDNFDTEITLVRQNEELMALLAERSREKKPIHSNRCESNSAWYKPSSAL